MPDLRYANQAIEHGLYDEASAVALVSIAQSLETITRLSIATHGTCPDCYHSYGSHGLGGGCTAITDYGRCECTEQRPAA